MVGWPPELDASTMGGHTQPMVTVKLIAGDTEPHVI
jgi:hypothetical protein